MPWFQTLCRRTGLALHGVMHPDGRRREEVNRKIEETRVSDTVTLRRTTIEEIEVSPKKAEAADAP